MEDKYNMKKKHDITINTKSKFIGIPFVQIIKKIKIPKSEKWIKDCIGIAWNDETCRVKTGKIAVNPNTGERVYLCTECIRKFTGYDRILL